KLTDDISRLQPGALIRDNGFAVSEDSIEEHAQEITQWAQSLGLDQENTDAENETIQTAAHGQVDAGTRQTFYLWEEGNMPSVTEYTENNGSYSDDPDFRPTVRTFPVPKGTEIKGAVLICAGGAFQYRSDQLDDSYVPDELDQVSADASACGMIYAFYGRLSVASTDVEKFGESDLPPTYFAYGTRDPFVEEFEECIQALEEAGVPVESQVLEGMPHGFGAE